MNDAAVSVALKFVDQATAPMKAALGNIEKSTKGIESAFGLAAKAAGALFAGFTVGAFASDVIETGKTIQGLDNAFKAITGSSTGARSEMAFLRSETERLGQNTLSAAQGLKTIEAAAMGTKLAGQGARDIFSAVSEAATVLGLKSEETQGALLAIGQMMSKGKVQAEELRGQLGERLPGAFQIAARAMGVTTAALDKMLQDGQVVAEDFLPKFAKALHEQYGGSVGDAANSATAATNRWDNAVMDLKAALASQLLPTFTSVVKGATEVVKAFSDADVKAKALKTSVQDLSTLGAIQIDVDFRYSGKTPDQLIKEWNVGGSQKGIGDFFSGLDSGFRRFLKDPTGRSGMLLNPVPEMAGPFRQLEEAAMATRKLNPELMRLNQTQKDVAVSANMVGEATKKAKEIVKDSVPQTQKLKEKMETLDTAYKFGSISAQEYKAAHDHLAAQLEKVEAKGSGAARAAKEYSKELEQVRQSMLKLEKTRADAIISSQNDVFGTFQPGAMDAGIRTGGTMNEVASVRMKAHFDMLEEGKQIYEDVRTPAERYRQEVDKLTYLLGYGAITQDTFSRAVANAADQFDETRSQAKRAAGEIQRSLGDGLYNILKGDFENIGSSFGDMILKMIADAQAAQLARWLFGDLVGGSGSGIFGGILSGIVGWFGGGAAAPHAKGDYWFTEPTAAVGLRTGKRHLIAEAGRPEYLAGSESRGGSTVVQPRMSVKLVVDPNLKMRADDGPTTKEAEGWQKTVFLRALTTDEEFRTTASSFLQRKQ
jgi:tape measure domain-containing protein